MRNSRVLKMVVVAMLAALGATLQFFGFPLLPSVAFLKVDFSDIPVMVSMFLFGPFAGIVTALIRSILHLVLTGPSPQNMVGDAASFLATTLFTLPMYYFFNKGTHKLRNKIAGIASGILAMTAFMSIANYFVITPLYLSLYGVTAQSFLGRSMESYIAVGIIPFNLIKGVIISTVFMIFYTQILPWLNKKQARVGNTPSKINNN
ncbi:ECF transporter S component [uncultured Enterococcus sp.]|uniref:ECF transporter S component n=1 Tax=uncultured Enterococcus sp. TaxID=167972 RepID=UPI002AA95AA4|nr:ECF transporter S component [uncultured Enterococcus sp.]